MAAIIFLLCIVFFMSAAPSCACMTILVGRKASSSGEVLVAHNEDAPGRFTMQTHLVRKKRRRPGTMMTFEPDLAKIELGQTRTSLLWSEAKTYSNDYSDSAFCDLYVNGYGVVICTNNCANSREDNPELTDGGIGYGLRRIVAERSHTAKEALEIACRLVDEYGYASSGRSYSFADKDEIYVMQIVHGKHYAIARVPDDEVAVIPNHYTIHEPDRKTRGYDELIEYAVKRGWYDADEGAFDFARAYQAPDSYGLEKNTHRHVRAFEILLEMDLSGLLKTEWQPLPFSIKPAYKVNIPTLKRILRTHYEGTSSDNSGGNSPHFTKPLTVCNSDTLESTIIQVRHNPDRILLRKALGCPCCSPYIGWYFGITSAPEGYEDTDPDEALTEHFMTKPEDMDCRDNAWYRSREIQTAYNILYREQGELVRSRVKELEERIERKIHTLDPQIELRLRNEPDIARAMMEGAIRMGAEAVDEFTKNMRKELNVIACEALTPARKGEKFRVRVPAGVVNFGELDVSLCRCGTSYDDISRWSECAGGFERSSNYFELEFRPGEWISEAVPCFTDLYMLLVGKSGKKYAGIVKVQVRE